LIGGQPHSLTNQAAVKLSCVWFEAHWLPPLTNSLKHRLARSLFLYALCNGWLREQSTIVEASSGSTAISEAYFARLLGLPFVAVIPAGTSRMKIEAIEFYGGHCHLVANPQAQLPDALRHLGSSLSGP